MIIIFLVNEEKKASDIKVEDQPMSREQTSTKSKNKKLNARRNNVAIWLTYDGLMASVGFLLIFSTSDQQVE